MFVTVSPSYLAMKGVSIALLLLALLQGDAAFKTSLRRTPLRGNQQLHLIPEIHQALSNRGLHFNVITNQVQQSLPLVDYAVAMYSKVDKTGFIGFIATYMEEAIDLGRSVLGSYGVPIILFTLIGELLYTLYIR